MPNYRRSHVTGATYFFTVVTNQRIPVLTTLSVRAALRQSINFVRKSRYFDVLAWVLLPDHLHCIWQLPEGDADYSARWSAIKRITTQTVGKLKSSSESRGNRREGALWQRRFWEHQIRDEADFSTHADYIHWNPMKHGLVKRVGDWPYSTFHRYVKEGIYPGDWGGITDSQEGDFGE